LADEDLAGEDLAGEDLADERVAEVRVADEARLPLRVGDIENSFRVRFACADAVRERGAAGCE
jgi:hypothetical protein